MSYNKNTSVSNSLTSEILKLILPAVPYALVTGEGNNDNHANGSVYVLCYASVNEELFAEIRVKDTDCDFSDIIRAERVKAGKSVAYDRLHDSGSGEEEPPKTLKSAPLVPLQQLFTLKNTSRPADKSTHLVCSMSDALALLQDLMEYSSSKWEIREVSVTAVMQNVLDTKFQGIHLD